MMFRDGNLRDYAIAMTAKPRYYFVDARHDHRFISRVGISFHKKDDRLIVV